MKKNFNLIDVSFGSDASGCDFCSSNIKRLWCEYTCSPDQDKFIFNHGYANVTDPGDPTNLVLVLN